jgi:hypothetical protein
MKPDRDGDEGGESPCLAAQFAEELGYEPENLTPDRVIAATVSARGVTPAE